MPQHHRSIDDAFLGEVGALMDSLPVARTKQMDKNFRSCKEAWGQIAQFRGAKDDVLRRLSSILEKVSKQPGFSYLEARKERPPELLLTVDEVKEYLAVMTFVGVPDTYAYPHHIWRIGQDTFVLWPSDVMGERGGESRRARWKRWWQFWK